MKVKIFKERDIIITAYGLKPLSTFYFYVNRERITSRVKELGKNLGEPMTTDKNGKLEIAYYIDSGLPSYSSKSIKAKTNLLKARPLELVLTTYQANNLPSNFEESSLSHAKTILYP